MVNQEQAFMQAMLETPNDLALRMVFADWLEERGDPRGELLRLTHTLTQSIDVPQRAELESRMQALVDEGVQAVGPFWTNTLGMRFAWIPPGTFPMGSPKSEQEYVREHFGANKGVLAAQEIQHRVNLTQGFFLGIHQVTQAHWQAIMGHHPSYFKGENLPVETVSWLEAVEFCNKLSAKDGKKPCYRRVGDDIELVGGNGYRLPTEAEGNTLAEQVRPVRSASAMILSKSTSMPGIWTMLKQLILSSRKKRMPGAFSTCMATFGNGAKIGIRKITTKIHQIEIP